MALQKGIVTPLIEPTPLPPVFADELAAVLPVGAVTHLLFIAKQPDGQEVERVLQVRLVVPTDQIALMCQRLASGKVVPPWSPANDEEGYSS